jgi:uncharacterized membrane protein HdeD (DUF308 family)
MKSKQKVDFIISLFLLMIGLILIILPIYTTPNIKIIIRLIFVSYAIINIVQYILTKKTKDSEGLHTFIVSLVVLICTYIFKDWSSIPKLLAMTLMLWITLMALVKLKKVDYYHDRKDRMWKLKLLTLILFILTGIATSISLAYTSNVQTLIIGFFMVTHAILEMFEPIVKTLISHA